MFKLASARSRLISPSSSAMSIVWKPLRFSSSSASFHKQDAQHLLPSTRFLHTSIPPPLNTETNNIPTLNPPPTPTPLRPSLPLLPPYSYSFPSPPTPSEPIFLAPNFTHADPMVISPTLTTEQRFDYISLLRTVVAQGGGEMQMQINDDAGVGDEGDVLVGVRIVLGGKGGMEVVGEGRAVGRGEAMGLAAEDACLRLGIA